MEAPSAAHSPPKTRIFEHKICNFNGRENKFEQTAPVEYLTKWSEKISLFV